jgi:uncharacterized protein YjiS (DUF1127 family)
MLCGMRYCTIAKSTIRVTDVARRVSIVSGTRHVVREWRDGNRKRRHGFRLDDQTIRDIGLTRLEVTYREATMSLYKRAAHPWS